MQAIILAGGRGTRLRPITDLIPKPLIPINGRPIIEWQIAYLKRSGITDCVVSSGYKSAQIENFLRTRTYHGMAIRYSAEEEPLGTGGAIRRAMGMSAGDSFFVINGDVITDIPLGRMQGAPNCIAAVLLRTKFGVLETRDSKITNFAEKGQVPNTWMNAGVYRLSSSIRDDLPENGDIERTTFPRYARSGRLSLERFGDAFWHSIDSHRDIGECARGMPSWESYGAP